MQRIVAASLAAAAVLLAAGCGGRAGGPAPAASSPGPGNGAGEAPARESGAVRGVIRDLGTGGAPVSLVEVVAVHTGSRARRRDTSNYEGRYQIEGLTPGTYRLVASFADMQVVFDDIVVKAGNSTRVNVVFDSRAERERAAEGEAPAEPGAAPETGVVYGRVVDQQSGEPFPGAVITAFVTEAPGAPTTIANERGHYRIAGLRPDTYTLSIYYQLIDKGAVEVQRSNVEVEAGRATRVDLEIDTRVKR